MSDRKYTYSNAKILLNNKARRFRSYAFSALGKWPRVAKQRIQNRRVAKGMTAPIVLISSCIDEKNRGDAKYNGGVKVYNLWVKLLRENGYQAFIVTYDGTYEPWLMEHEPHVSLETVKQWKRSGIPLRFVTGWADATAFIDLADDLYFYDCEIAFTAGSHLPIMRRHMKQKNLKIATNSRIQQAWYMTSFKYYAKLIPVWSNTSLWNSASSQREEGLVGYMVEGPDTRKEIREIASICESKGVRLRFIEVKGEERACLDQLRACDYYLGMNPGKHPLFGEGCPLSQLESMHAGCVLIAYDVCGNREYLINNYSGFLAPRGRPEVIADHLIDLVHDKSLKERIREASIDLASLAFSSEGRIQLLKEFLDLEDIAEEPKTTGGEISN